MAHQTPIAVTIGVDIGKLHDPTALVIAEELPGDFHVVRDLERLPLGTSYPDVAAHLASVYRQAVGLLAAQQSEDEFHEKIRRGEYGRVLELSDASKLLRAQESVWTFVDATGCGLPVCDFLRERSGIPEGHLCAVMLTAGQESSVRRGQRDGSVSKSWMVSRLQTLLGDERLKLPKTAEAKACAAELEDFEMTITESATATYNARQGSHDDLITALALSVLVEQGRWQSGSFRYA
jgi:hypothetical protein